MNTVLTIIVVWLLLQIPAAFLVSAFLRVGRGDYAGYEGDE